MKILPFSSSRSNGLALTTPVFGIADRLAVTIDLGPDARNAVQGLTAQRQQFDTAGIADMEFTLNAIPQCASGRPERARRIGRGGGMIEDRELGFCHETRPIGARLPKAA
jgi:hypothetical protein